MECHKSYHNYDMSWKLHRRPQNRNKNNRKQCSSNLLFQGATTNPLHGPQTANELNTYMPPFTEEQIEKPSRFESM